MDEAYIELLDEEDKKVAIPKLPKGVKKLETLAGKKFEVLRRSEPMPTVGAGFGTGGESTNWVYLKCPFCGMEFKALERYGCFHHNVIPGGCPNCNFPHNIHNALMNALRKRRKK